MTEKTERWMIHDRQQAGADRLAAGCHTPMDRQNIEMNRRATADRQTAGGNERRAISRLCLLLLCVICFAAFSFTGGAAPAFAATLKAPTVVLESYGSTEIKVNVKKMAGADGYKIYRSTSKKGKFKAVKTIARKKTPYIDRGLKASTKYFYKVQAYAKTGGGKKFGAYSAVKSVKTKKTPNGNASKYAVKNITFENSDLNGQTAYFLGSSVTKGKGSIDGDTSFVEMLEKKYGMVVTKSAVNGTTLVDNGSDSYIARMKKLPKEAPDYFVCQLSTNDAAKMSPMGSYNTGEFNIKNFDTSTVLGAIEYVTAYAQNTWSCPVIFYIPTHFKDEWKYQSRYLDMIDYLLLIQAKWNKQYEDQLQIIDLWNNKASQFTSTDDRLLCMKDTLHPTNAGYLKKYLPVIGDYLKAAAKKIKEKLGLTAAVGQAASEKKSSAPEGLDEDDGAALDEADGAALDEADGAALDEADGAALDESDEAAPTSLR